MKKIVRAANVATVAVTVLGAFLGCSSKASNLLAPRVDPASAATAAMAAYDRNKDGILGDGEVSACPAFRQALAVIDQDKDRKLKPEELTARLEKLYARNIATMAIICRVTLDGKPLEGATLKFVPEAFLGSQMKVSSAVTDSDGRCIPALQDSGDKPVNGTQFGYYRIEVSKQEHGKEIVPDRYNKSTELGQEVSQDQNNIRGVFAIDLKS